MKTPLTYFLSTPDVKKAADEFQNFVKTMGEKPSVAIQQMNDKFDEAAKAIEDFKIDAPNDFAKNALNVLSPGNLTHVYVNSEIKLTRFFRSHRRSQGLPQVQG